MIGVLVNYSLFYYCECTVGNTGISDLHDSQTAAN